MSDCSNDYKDKQLEKHQDTNKALSAMETVISKYGDVEWII